MGIRLPLLLATLLSLSPAITVAFPATLTLERTVPLGASLETLKSRDQARHGRILQSSNVTGVQSSNVTGDVNYVVQGNANPFSVGLYYTRVKLGNPAKEFHVQIDTGSDALWVTCSPCDGCPTTSGLKFQPEFFDPTQSSTVKKLSCLDKRCTPLVTQQSTCSLSDLLNFQCSYSFAFGDGSKTSGYFVSDELHFETVLDNDKTTNSSANIMFGCSNSQAGELTESSRATDGIIGFGQNNASVISQLSSMGLVPRVFSHCLKGSDDGGGILVLGEIVEPGIVYTPIVKSQTHYNVNLESIAVNGQKLDIDSSVFATSETQGTMVDSGTTLATLAERAYDPFVKAIVNSVSSSTKPILLDGNQCFTAKRIDDSFPSVTLNFMGNASMTLKPQNYLRLASSDNSITWCIGWQKSPGTTILGDIVLKDKIFVYDLENQRIGWTDYDCSSSVNVSVPSGNESVSKTIQLSASSSGSSHSEYSNLLTTCIAAFLVHVFVLAML